MQIIQAEVTLHHIRDASRRQGMDGIRVPVEVAHVEAPFGVDEQAGRDASSRRQPDDVPPGETKTSAVCIEVPTDELDELIYRLSSYLSFDDDAVYFSD